MIGQIKWWTMPEWVWKGTSKKKNIFVLFSNFNYSVPFFPTPCYKTSVTVSRLICLSNVVLSCAVNTVYVLVHLVMCLLILNMNLFSSGSYRWNKIQIFLSQIRHFLEETVLSIESMDTLLRYFKHWGIPRSLIDVLIDFFYTWIVQLRLLNDCNLTAFQPA